MSGSERFAARRSFWIFTSRILQPHVKTLPHSPLLILLSSNPKSLPNFLGVHEFRIIEMYLSMARYSGRRLWSVMGNARSPSHLDQFNHRSDGRSVELRSAKDGWLPLSPHFDEVFGRYLRYLNIDPLHPLPSIPTFPKDDRSSYYPKALGRILVSIRWWFGPAMDAKRAQTGSDYSGRNSPRASGLRGLSNWFVSTLQLQHRPPAGTRTAPCFTSALPSPMLFLRAAREAMCEGQVTAMRSASSPIWRSTVVAKLLPSALRLEPSVLRCH